MTPKHVLMPRGSSWHLWVAEASACHCGCFRHHWGITAMCRSHVSKKEHGGRAEHGMFLGSYSLSLGTEPSQLALGKSCLLLDSAKVLVEKRRTGAYWWVPMNISILRSAKAYLLPYLSRVCNRVTEMRPPTPGSSLTIVVVTIRETTNFSSQLY